MTVASPSGFAEEAGAAGVRGFRFGTQSAHRGSTAGPRAAAGRSGSTQGRGCEQTVGGAEQHADLQRTGHT